MQRPGRIGGPATSRGRRRYGRLMPSRVARAGLLIAALACLCTLALLARGEKSSAASSKPNVIMFTTDDQTVRDMAVMPKTQALIGNAGRELPARLRLGPALLPLARHGPDRRVRAQHRRARQHSAGGRLQQSSTTRTTCRSGCSPTATGRSTSARCRTDSRTERGGQTYVPPGWGPFAGGSGPGSRGEFYGFIGPPSAYTDFTLDENGVHKTSTTPTTTRPTSTPTSRSSGSTTTSRTSPTRPLYMQVQFFAPARSRDTRSEVRQRLRHLSRSRSTQSFNEKNVKDKPALDQEDQALRPGPDREDPGPLPAPPRDAAIGG